MRNPDMIGEDRGPCLIVVKNGNATRITLGHANGAIPIIRTYTAGGQVISGTSME
jgi:hypothetical protein